MQMEVSDVIDAAKRFLKTHAGYTIISIASVDADEGKKQWKVIAEIGLFAATRKELIVDDRDGNVVRYRDAQ